jgi:hypothetical protein
MAVLGRLLVSSAERLDLPDFLSIDSYTQGDFKYLMKSFVGSDRPYILKGFEVIDPANSIGTQNITIGIANSVVYYPESKAGPFFYGLEEGDPKAAPLIPELRKNATNYVYLVLTTFNAAKDTRAFWDPDKEGGIGGEFTQEVETESVLTVDINVSISAFPENTIPVCKVKVGANFIESIEDCRDMMFRLGSGGLNTNPLSRYTFREQPLSVFARSEPNTLMSSTLSPNSFRGGDKNIRSLKEWMDVVMTKLLELGGTTYWYQDTSTFSLVNLFKDSLATSIRSKGTWENSSTTPGQLSWTEDIVMQSMTDKRDIIIRGESYQSGEGSKSLDNGQVMFIVQERNKPINNGSTSVEWFNALNYIEGELGAFENLTKGDWVKKAGDPDGKYLRVEEFYNVAPPSTGTVVAPEVALCVKLSEPYYGLTELSQAIYSKGEYLSTDIQVTDRNDPILSEAGGDLCWLATRSDRVLNIASIVSTEISIDIEDHDGEKAKCTVVSGTHSLSDKQRIHVSGTSNFDGEYQVEVESTTVFYINISGGPFADESNQKAYYATAVTNSNFTQDNFQLESENHVFDVDNIVIISDSSAFNGTYKVFPKDSVTFTFPFDGLAVENPASEPRVTSVEIYVRTDIGPTKIEQGESKEIGKVDSQNIMSFIGMENSAMMKPVYATEPNYNTLDGFANYNSSSADNLTQRVSKLTAMMADKTQDKTITYNLQGTYAIVKSNSMLNPGSKEIAAFAKVGKIPKLIFMQPSTKWKVEITLTGTLALGAGANNFGQVAYINMNRNADTIISDLGSISVVDIEKLPLEENIFIFAIRYSDADDIILWDGTPIREYLTAMEELATETTTISLPSSASISSDQYFTINSSLDINEYYVWFNKNGTGSDPLVVGKIGIEVPIVTGDGAIIVAANTVSAINSIASADFTVVDNTDGTITLTNSIAGFCTDAANFNVGGSFAVNIDVDGTGSSLHYIADGDLLETALKKLDQKLYEIALAVPETAYEETLQITSSVASGASLILPLDSRRSNLVKGYTVGEGQLEVFLNGQYLTQGEDWLEVGVSGSESNTIQIQQDLYPGDLVLLRIDNHSIGSGGDSGSGSGEANTASNVGGGAGVFQSKVGIDLRFRSLVAGAGVSIAQAANAITISSTPTAAALNVVTVTSSNYNVLPSNDVVLIYNSGVNVNVTLPAAALNIGKKIDIKKVDAGNVLSIKGQSGDTLDGVDIFASSWDVLIQYECVSVISNGISWFII